MLLCMVGACCVTSGTHRFIVLHLLLPYLQSAYALPLITRQSTVKLSPTIDFVSFVLFLNLNLPPGAPQDGG
jgi:hypothetical protein